MKICKKNQMELKKWLEKVLRNYYKGIVNGDGFLYAKGNVPVLLTAHMDTVHKEQCDYIEIMKVEGNTILSSKKGIGGDDRCGIWMIYRILRDTKFRPSILFCEDEEIGGVGSDKFTKTKYMDDLKELKYFIELDRANADDAVYYDCGNEEFKEYIEKVTGYKESYGSFSDISHLSPVADKASVNLSCGYYKAHTTNEYVVFEEMENTVEAVKKLLADADNVDAFDYQEANYWNDDNVFDWFGDGNKTVLFNDDDDYDRLDKMNYEIIFMENGKEEWDYISAYSYAEALGYLFEAHPTITYNDVLDYYTYDEIGTIVNL